MPRPQKSRRICCYPDYWSFAPDQDKANDTIVMSLDEFETIRLIDYHSKTQEQCAAEMNVARTTVTAIYDTARKKLAQALVVGGAVGHNPISIIVPCHRVVGSDGSLTGYAGGLDKKKALLKLEKYSI
ncbi:MULTISPECIES: methylated-DNA--[protein]-cysteine S-methyltransferase [Ruminococcus]|uniref:methylated-DNA--[protein]-cysteine S-methyltransferase n=1 Tax=Ruminococcus TaxID=1263 RepID=UPI000688A432|nr:MULTISPECIES: methylated-DNA--[protein]-cysteine S-methyltransferase [Ruminococcus]